MLSQLITLYKNNLNLIDNWILTYRLNTVPTRGGSSIHFSNSSENVL